MVFLLEIFRVFYLVVKLLLVLRMFGKVRIVLLVYEFVVRKVVLIVLLFDRKVLVNLVFFSCFSSSVVFGVYLV